MTKWEYKIVKINVQRLIHGDMRTGPLEKKLNELGLEGWEVLNVFDLNSVDGKSSNVVVSMKRPVADGM